MKTITKHISLPDGLADTGLARQIAEMIEALPVFLRDDAISLLVALVEGRVGEAEKSETGKP